jgi:ABC-type Fe3+-hydroxamate transport system substrate-binding protein
MQSLCSVCSVDFCQVELVAAGIEPPPKLIDLNPANLQDVLADVERVGFELGQPAAGKAAADKLRARLQAALDRVPTAAPGSKPPSVAFIEWVEPIFVGGHWTPQLIHMAGGSHPLNPPK